MGGLLLGGWGVSAPGGAWSWGVPASGGSLVETPRMATAASGTHPTGMHSCICLLFITYLLLTGTLQVTKN